MKRLSVGKQLDASALALGCWNIGRLDEAGATALVDTAVREGIDYFDTADIYGGGRSEELLGKAVANLHLRESIKIQTKCAIRKGYYDFSKEHILESVDGSLRRLGTDYIDVLLLHRPDTLMEPEEVAEAFSKLESEGKVRYFGVSNHNPAQIELLSRYLPQKLIADQLQFSMTNTSMIDSGINVNTVNPPALDRDGSVLEYCRLRDITIQSWSPLQYGFFQGTYVDNYEKFPELNKALDRFAEAKGVTKVAIIFAWILRHPARIQALTGTTNPVHLHEACAASGIELSREEWYELYRANGNIIP